MPRPQHFLPLVLGLLAWLPSVWVAGWALDDRELIFGNPVIDGSAPWWSAFGRDYFHHLGDAGQWRPLAALSLRASHALWGDWAPGYHLENLAYHLLVIALATEICRRSFRTRAWVFGLCVFAVHPALADVVAWVSGRTSSVSAAVGLAGVLLALHARTARGVWMASAIAAGGALLAKEDGILFAPLCVLLVTRGQTPRAWRAALLGASSALLVVFAARAFALGHLLPHATHPALGDAGLAMRLEVGGQVWLESLRLACFPFGHPPQYRADFLAAQASPLSPRGAALLGWTLAIAVPSVLWLARRRVGRTTAFSALFAALALLPVVQLVPLGEIFAPRFLYLPLLFAAPALGALCGALPRTPRVIVWALVPLVLIPLAWRRTTVYASRATWRAEMLQHQPDDAPSWNGLGLAREDDGDLEGARAAYQRATQLRPTYSRAWSNLARLLQGAGEDDEALRMFERAAEVGPRNPVAHANLGGRLLARGDAARGDAARAERAYRRATELAPGMVAAWRGLARALHAQGRTADARAALTKGLALDPTDERSLALRAQWIEAADRSTGVR